MLSIFAVLQASGVFRSGTSGRSASPLHFPGHPTGRSCRRVEIFIVLIRCRGELGDDLRDWCMEPIAGRFALGRRRDRSSESSDYVRPFWNLALWGPTPAAVSNAAVASMTAGKSWLEEICCFSVGNNRMEVNLLVPHKHRHNESLNSRQQTTGRKN